MAFIAVLLAKTLDPIGFLIVLVISLFSRKKWIIPISAIFSSIIIESILTSSQISRNWGESIIPGLIASSVHAIICYFIINLFRKNKTIKTSNEEQT